MSPTMFMPTTMGQSTSEFKAAVAPAPPRELLVKFPILLDADKQPELQARIAAFDFENCSAQSIAELSQASTVALNRVLDTALSQVTKTEQPQLFKLVDTLSEEVAKEGLGELADRILTEKPSVITRLLGVFNKNLLQRRLDRAYEELGRVARAKSKSLSDVIIAREQKLHLEMEKLANELRNFEHLKLEYQSAFNSFAAEVSFLYGAIAKAQLEMPELLAKAANDVIKQQDLQDKLQSLESVTLSREAMMTRMPAEQLVIRQLQNAAIATYQELAITMGDRFASIRMTLLGIHGAHLVKGVQRLGQANAVLDAQLQEARAKLMGAVVTTAANAPGDNRLQQANDLKRVVADTKALQVLVAAARETNKQKFAEAQATLVQVRHELLDLGKQLTPGTAVTL